MLQLQHIRKSYTTGSFTQTALDDVSVAFRDNEFVAILGPSGSGKTTMLNIIGGLDHYDTGDLIIDGISTKKYKDRDWDTYRNNRIGFVFQSYNLIPHQTVLANVELALTLSGVSREERRTRAIAELERVGLGDHVNKRPNQLSGGQMQRVAIARALINNPEILLADEPTGALDSKTSVQIMDLLTEIAKDRLVVMVTHNPELAEQYATRIVNLADGVIRSDTDPFEPTADEMRESTKKVRRTSMGPLTALALSFNNLMTKKGRTLMTAFAGSIGIIGIAAILSLANGVNAYIKTVEEETLSEYPLQIMSTGLDMTSMLLGSVPEGAPDASEGAGEDAADSGEGAPTEEVGVVEMITTMFGSVGSNDLASLKAYLDSGESGIEPYVNAIDYTYDVAPQIFSSDVDNLRQVNPDRSMASLGIGSGTSSNSLMSMAMSTDVFFEMPDDPGLYESQYDVKAGRWPESPNEVVLVTTAGGRISDFMLYTLGLRDAAELDEMVRQFAAEEDVVIPDDIEPVSYEDVLNVRFKLVNAADWYSYDADYGVWVDKSDDNVFMRELVAAGEDIAVVGIVTPSPDAKATMLQPGLNYPASLVTHVIDQAAASQIVQDQLADPSVNVLTGKPFGEEDDEESAFDMDSLFTINSEALQAAFKIDQRKLSVDMSNTLNLQGVAANLPPAPEPDMAALTGSLDLELSDEQVSGLVTNVMGAFQAYLKTLPPEEQAAAMTDFGGAFAKFLKSPAGQAAVAAQTMKIAQEKDLENQVARALQGYVTSTMTSYMSTMAKAMETQVTAAMQKGMAQMGANMASAVSIDADAFADAFEMNMTEDELRDLMMSLMTSEDATYDSNLRTLGYADPAKPAGIDIYPVDFDAKAHVIQILDDYNARMEAEGADDKVITYTDFVGTLMASVTDIVNMISYVLVAFVAISLVVSSIMIGVITYISVLERRKEIGILRAIGASKGDISRIFNAETIIEGLVAGLLGVGITALGCIPVNAVVYSLFDVPNVAQLPWQAAAILVGISVFLSFIAGLIPASSASRKDPVEALRSE